MCFIVEKSFHFAKFAAIFSKNDPGTYLQTSSDKNHLICSGKQNSVRDKNEQKSLQEKLFIGFKTNLLNVDPQFPNVKRIEMDAEPRG